MATTAYRVHLEPFDGPLDLLMYLVRRDELDVTTLSIAGVADQFLEFLSLLKWIDFDEVGEFLVIAATLLEMKSRLALPQSTVEEAELPNETPVYTAPSQLVAQLLEYRRYKDASHRLERIQAEWLDRFPRLQDERPQYGKDPASDFLKDVELWDLVSALSRIVRHQHVELATHIQEEELPLHLVVEQVREQVLAEKEVSFHALFAEERKRGKIIGIFLAILELVRHHGFRAVQETAGGDIVILCPPDDYVGADGPVELTFA